MINVIGLGYIGLPTALMMASHGVEVVGTDYNKKLVDTLRSGRTTFKEAGRVVCAGGQGRNTVYHGIPGHRHIHCFGSDSI